MKSFASIQDEEQLHARAAAYAPWLRMPRWLLLCCSCLAAAGSFAPTCEFVPGIALSMALRLYSPRLLLEREREKKRAVQEWRGSIGSTPREYLHKHGGSGGGGGGSSCRVNGQEEKKGPITVYCIGARCWQPNVWSKRRR